MPSPGAQPIGRPASPLITASVLDSRSRGDMSRRITVVLLCATLMVPVLGAPTASADPNVVMSSAECKIRRPLGSIAATDPQIRTTGARWQAADPQRDVRFLNASVGSVVGLDGVFVEVEEESATTASYQQVLTVMVDGQQRTLDAPVSADCTTLPKEIRSRSGTTRIDFFNFSCQPARPALDFGSQLGVTFQLAHAGYTPIEAQGSVAGQSLSVLDVFGSFVLFTTIQRPAEAYDLAGTITATYEPDGGGSTLVETYDIDVTAQCPDFAGLVEFTDTFGSVFEQDIAWLASEGITQGCNPPVNDRFCPHDPVTRGQMAAFLVRALGYTDQGSATFTDTDGNVFETDIRKLATAGVTFGCNPPTNDRFCPHDPVTRGQMAAFLVRALGYTDQGSATFTDTDGNVFETDIRKLATAGVTFGCNPPTNDRFCPHDPVTRGQMAAFLRRALSD